MADKEISMEDAKKYLKEYYDIPELIIKAMESLGYDFKKNHEKFSYTYILEYLCEKLIKTYRKDIMDDTYDKLNAEWELHIPVDLKGIYDVNSGRFVRNKALKKFITSLGLYEWIVIRLENKRMVVDDDAICWGFNKDEQTGEGKGIMTVEKDSNGKYVYNFFDR